VELSSPAGDASGVEVLEESEGVLPARAESVPEGGHGEKLKKREEKMKK
jgi:hypothetical protein